MSKSKFIGSINDLLLDVKLPSKGIKFHAEAPNFRPRDAQRYLKAKAFWITGLIDTKIREKARGILLNAIGTGEALSKTIQKLSDTFEPYVGDENVLRDDEVVSPSRLETIVRTNATDAFNQGRIVEARQAGEFLVGFQYSAVLDQVTTDVCKFLDGKAFRPDDPLLDTLRPPRHFSCRATLIPISIDEEVAEDDFITPREADEALELSGEDFGGPARSTGMRGAKFSEVAEFYSPDQPRDEEGQWSETGGGGGKSGGGRDFSGKSWSEAMGKASPLFTARDQYNSKESDALEGYARKEHKSINQGLRSQPPRTSKDIVTIMEAFSKSSVKEDIVVYRGMRTVKFKGKNLTGVVIQDRGFLSTSLQQGVAGKFSEAGASSPNEESVVFRIVVPKGSKAIFLGGGISRLSYENEVLFPPRRKIKVVSDKRVEGARFIQARMI